MAETPEVEQRVLHCWKDYRVHLEETGKVYSDEWVSTYCEGNKTCILEARHTGEHEFTDDSQIVGRSWETRAAPSPWSDFTDLSGDL